MHIGSLIKQLASLIFMIVETNFDIARKKRV